MNQINESIEFVISIDNRNIRVGDLNNLETYLKTEFCLSNFDFKVTYYDLVYNYGIQLADLIVNTFYNSYKDRKIVEKVLPCLKGKNFRVSLFPGRKIKGRITKIEYNNNENKLNIIIMRTCGFSVKMLHFFKRIFSKNVTL